MLLTAAGGFLLAIGMLWALQGAGLVDWPRGSFMVAQAEWIMYGSLTAMAGAAMLWWARDRARR